MCILIEIIEEIRKSIIGKQNTKNSVILDSAVIPYMVITRFLCFVRIPQKTTKKKQFTVNYEP